MQRDYMRRAISLAWRGWGRVHPNPLVGAVVVRDGEVVGEGYHAVYGGPHAEVAAIQDAGDRARGATIYVTLEPCAHEGKTPACTRAIRAAGITRLVYGAADPHPEARGGAERLREAGLDVSGGVERGEVRAQNAAFFHAIERQRPYLVLKYGLSLDARLAEAAGRTTAVTGPESWEEVHRLRAGFDAVMIGAATARTDDPRLTVRGSVTPRTPPIRIVADTDAQLPPDSRLARTAHDAPLWVLSAHGAPGDRTRALERVGARVVRVRRSESGLDLEEAVDRLWAEGVRSVFCEGGGRLGASLLAADRVERMYLFYAPRLFGRAGVPAFPGPVSAEAAGGWRLWSVRRFGDDVQLTLDRDRS